MGIYSTMDLSREETIEKLKEAFQDLESLTDIELCDLMFTVFGDKWGANFRIVGEDNGS